MAPIRDRGVETWVNKATGAKGGYWAGVAELPIKSRSGWQVPYMLRRGHNLLKKVFLFLSEL